MNFEILYTDMVSENWQVLAQSPVVPSVGDLVSLPRDRHARIFIVEHVYKLNRDEITVFDHFKVYLDWDIS